MTYDDVLEHFGSQSKIGAALGIGQSTVSLWGGIVPEAYQFQIEIITAGKLKVDEYLRWPANDPRHVKPVKQLAMT